MYRITKVTNNTNSRCYYNIEEQKSFLLLLKRWKTVKYYEHGVYLTDKDFTSLLSALYWIRKDMLDKKFKETKQIEYTFASIEQVNEAIEKILAQQKAENDALNAMSDEEYYNGKKTNTKDESAN